MVRVWVQRLAGERWESELRNFTDSQTAFLFAVRILVGVSRVVVTWYTARHPSFTHTL